MLTDHLPAAAAATVVASAFALSTGERWRWRRRPHDGAWTVALILFALASAALLAGAAAGWSPFTFRAFFLLGAIANVPVLGLGTVYLLGGRRWGDRSSRVVSAFVIFSAGVMVAAPLRSELPSTGLPRGSEMFDPLPRILAAMGSGVGAMIVFGGAVWSMARLLRGRHRRGTAASVSPARLAAANGLLAAGTVALSAGGLANSTLDEMDAFALSLVVGIVLLFAGFLTASAPRRPPASQSGVGLSGSPAATLSTTARISSTRNGFFT